MLRGCVSDCIGVRGRVGERRMRGCVENHYLTMAL